MNHCGPCIDKFNAEKQALIAEVDLLRAQQGVQASSPHRGWKDVQDLVLEALSGTYYEGISLDRMSRLTLCEIFEAIRFHDEDGTGTPFEVIPNPMEQVRRITVEPGDVLVYQSQEQLPSKALHNIQALMKERFPNNPILILDEGDYIEVYHVEESEDAPTGAEAADDEGGDDEALRPQAEE